MNTYLMFAYIAIWIISGMATATALRSDNPILNWTYIVLGPLTGIAALLGAVLQGVLTLSGNLFLWIGRIGKPSQ